MNNYIDEPRLIFRDTIKNNLIGPGSDVFVSNAEEEIISDYPLSRYFSGILFPEKQVDNTQKDSIGNNANVNANTAIEDSTDDTPSPKIEDSENTLSISKEILEKEPDNIACLLAKANCLNETGNLDEALELYNKILLLDPNCYLAYGGRGIAYQKFGNNDQAFSDLNYAIKKVNNSPILFTQRALIHIEHQNFKLALNDLNHALKIDKNFKFAKLNRAFVFRVLGEFGKAFSDIETTDDLEGIDSEGFHQKGIVYLKNNKVNEALTYYNKAIELNDKNIEALYSRAMLYSQINDFDNAFVDLDKAMQLENSHFKDYLFNGYADVYRRMKSFDKAISFTKAALDHNKNFFWAYITLAEIYGEIDKKESFYENLRLGLESGFDINDIDEEIKIKYFKTKEFKSFLKTIKRRKPSG